MALLVQGNSILSLNLSIDFLKASLGNRQNVLMKNFFQEFLRNFISKFLFIRLLDIKIMIFIKRHINLLIVVIQIFYRIQAYSIDSKISIIEVSEFFCSRNTWFWFFRFFAPWLRLFLRFWFFNVKYKYLSFSKLLDITRHRQFCDTFFSF